jgi:spermidine/putrescine transport system ATP-binding protein
VTSGLGQLALTGLVKRFGDELAVDGLNLDIGAGEFFSLLGSSGSGKTTTLRMIAGFEQPDAGAIRLDGRDLSQVPPHKRPVNTVFQSYALFPFLTVQQNVEFGLRYKPLGKGAERRRVAETLELVQMGALAKRKPHQLSGGQQQRVALARALVLAPTVLLLDEPMGALDAKLRKQLQRELRSLQRVVGTTFVYVTHDQEEALTMSDHLAVLHDGRLMQVGTPSEVYSRPANAYVAGFLGTANLFEATVLSGGGGEVTCRLDGLVVVASCLTPPAPGSRVNLVIRPERVELTARDATADPSAVNAFTGHVEGLAFRGAQTTVTVTHGDIRLLADIPNVHGEVPDFLSEGRDVDVRISPAAIQLLADENQGKAASAPPQQVAEPAS